MNKDRRKDLDRAIALMEKILPLMEEARGIIDDAANGEQEYHDNMNENLQNGEKGQRASEVAEILAGIVENIDALNVDETISALEDAKN